MDREEEIKLIAFKLWEEEGCPQGRGCEHWIKAEAVWEGIKGKKKPSVVNKTAAKKTTSSSKTSKSAIS